MAHKHDYKKREFLDELETKKSLSRKMIDQMDIPMSKNQNPIRSTKNNNNKSNKSNKKKT